LIGSDSDSYDPGIEKAEEDNFVQKYHIDTGPHEEYFGKGITQV